MGSKIIIELPDSVEEEQEVIHFLEQKGVRIDREPASVAQEPGPNSGSRWARAAERLKSEGFLEGQGEAVKQLQRDFRDDFSF